MATMTADEFIQRWGLNAQAITQLNELDPELQAAVIQEFVPREGTRDASNLFMSFCRSRIASAAKAAGGVSGTPTTGAGAETRRFEADEFIMKWNLNAESQNILFGLPQNIFSAVIESFQPKGEARDIDNMFQAFTRSRVKSANRGGQTGGLRSRQDVTDFIQKWGLNSESYAVLMQLPMNVLDGILTSFKPKGEARDINNMFQAFARSRLNNAMIAAQQGLPIPSAAPMAGAYTGFSSIIGQPQMMMPQLPRGRGGMQPAGMVNFNAPAKIQDFVRRRNLGEVPHMLLEALAKHHPAVADQIMMEFNPTDRSRDANETFVSFWTPRAIKALSDVYGLKPESCLYFKTLDTSLQAAIVSEFCPRDTSKVNDMNGLFGSFMKSRVRTAQQQGQLGVAASQVDMGQLGMTMGMPELSRKRPLDSVSAFITQWNLSPSCEDMMNILTPAQQAEIIERFAPKHNTRDVEGLFKKFAASVQQKAM